MIITSIQTEKLMPVTAKAVKYHLSPHTKLSMADCKICTDGPAFGNELIKPCKCNSLVHRPCLNEWIKVSRNPIALNHCEVCLTKYEYEPVAGASLTRAKYFYLFLMIRDLILVLLGVAASTAAAYLITSYLINAPNEDYTEHGTKTLTVAACTIALTGMIMFVSIIIYIISFYILRCCCLWAGVDSWQHREPYLIYLATYDTKSSPNIDLECCADSDCFCINPWFRCGLINIDVGDGCDGCDDEGAIILMLFCAVLCVFIMAFFILWLVIKIVSVHIMNLRKTSLVGTRRIKDLDVSINI